MSTALEQATYLEEFADFLASSPSPEEILAYHTSDEVHRMGQQLLRKLRRGSLTDKEQQQLHDFTNTERLVRLVKARIVARKAQCK